MFRTIRALVIVAVVGMLPGSAAAQQTVAGLTEQLQQLRADKERVESQLRILRDGNSAGVLFGYFQQNLTENTPAEFVPVTGGAIPKGYVSIALPMSMKSISDRLTLEMMAGNVTREQAVQVLEGLRIGAAAKRNKSVREGLERAERDYLAQLKTLDAAIASAEFARGLLAGGVDPPANGIRIGAGVLKDAQGKRPTGLFEIKKDGQRTQLAITLHPTVKYLGVEESIDAANQVVVYKFEYQFTREFGGHKVRGHSKVNFRANTAEDTIEEVFDTQANAWRAYPVRDRVTMTHKLVWGQTLEDRRLLSERGKLEAAPGTNRAEVTFMIQQRAGANYSFELKAPATRLSFRVQKVGGGDEVAGDMPERGKPLRRVSFGPNEGVETYRITVIGVGPNLPASYELEVWERWNVNGNVPSLEWESR